MLRAPPARAALARPDLVLALALAHHLVITGNIPVNALVVLARRVRRPSLVVEFVERSGDPMVKQLLLNKIDNYDDWERERFETELEQRCRIVDRLELGSGTRSLYLARAR